MFQMLCNNFNHDKSSSILQLLKDKLRDLRKLLKYINGTTTSVSKVLILIGVLPIIFALYLKDLLVFVFIYPIIIIIIFIHIIVHFIFVIILLTS